MKRNHKIAIAAVLGIGVVIAALNPRVAFNDGKFYAMSCSTKHFIIPSSEDNDFKIPGGLYNAESLVKKLYPQMLANYTRDTAGNPFAGLGLALIGNMKEPMVDIVDTSIEDACAGNDLTYLAVFENLGKY